MNLTDGKVLCGRRYFDGSGGNNHALLHFQETTYPLAVKLGTITPDGAGTLMVQGFFCGKDVQVQLKRNSFLDNIDGELMGMCHCKLCLDNAITLGSDSGSLTKAHLRCR